MVRPDALVVTPLVVTPLVATPLLYPRPHQGEPGRGDIGRNSPVVPSETRVNRHAGGVTVGGACEEEVVRVSEHRERRGAGRVGCNHVQEIHLDRVRTPTFTMFADPNYFLFAGTPDRKSTRLNSSHDQISYAV